MGNGSGPVQALVLSGGAAFGAYEVGVVQALTEGNCPATGGRPLEPSILTGTSVGAYNATVLACHPERPAAEAAAHLADLWRRRIAEGPGRCGNGVYRLRANPLPFFDPTCLLRHPLAPLRAAVEDGSFLARFALGRGLGLASGNQPVADWLLDLLDLEAVFSAEPLHTLVAETVDLAGLARSCQQLILVAANWRDGSVRLFTREEIVERVGRTAVLASSALPGIFPQVEIDGVPFADGGLVMNTPLRPAIRAGADELHVVYVDPLIEDMPLDISAGTLDTLYRGLAISWANNVNNNVLDVKIVNQALELVELLSTEQRLALEQRLSALGDLAARLRQRRNSPAYRPLVVHRYRPSVDLGSAHGLLDFGHQRIAERIAQGYRDAQNHDCLASGCVL